MTILDLIEQIQQEHQQCCIVTNCRDRNCRLGLRGLTAEQMVIINGTKHQMAHKIGGRLCDRLIISNEHGGFVSAVELKGGKTQPSLRSIVEQIQAGFNLAESLLGGRALDQWLPILAFSGHTGSITPTALRSKENSVTILGTRMAITKTRCETELASILAN